MDLQEKINAELCAIRRALLISGVIIAVLGFVASLTIFSASVWLRYGLSTLIAGWGINRLWLGLRMLVFGPTEAQIAYARKCVVDALSWNRD